MYHHTGSTVGLNRVVDQGNPEFDSFKPFAKLTDINVVKH